VDVNALGRWAAITVVALGVLYLLVLARGVALFGLATPIGDPILAIMEVITVLSAVAVTTMVAAIAATASASRRVWATLAVTFTGLFAGATTLVHVIALTAGRQLGGPLLVWPSVLYAAELAAWDALLGIALLCAALTFEESPRLRAIRIGLGAAGLLCLVGLIAPALGVMALQRIGIAGYAVVLPVVCAQLAREFRARPFTPNDAVA
jgi:hypothetical protein